MADTMEFDGLSDFDELEALFGQDDSDLKRMEKVMLTQNLEGFASRFGRASCRERVCQYV